MVYSLIHKIWDFKEGGLRYRTLNFLKRTESLSRSELIKIQEEHLREILLCAYNTSFYKAIFLARNISLDDIKSTSAIKLLSMLPVLTKQDVRANVQNMLNPDIPETQYRYAKTGGSTGVSLNLIFDENCQKIRNGAQMFADGFANWTPGVRTAAIWGNPPIPKTLKQKVRRKLLERVIYLDTMSLNGETIENFVTEWFKNPPIVIFGHAHSIFQLAKFLDEKNINGLNPKGIVTTSMMLLQHERELIEKIFSCKVTNRYGCEEVGLIAVECEKHQGMHLNTSQLIVECLDENDQPVPAGKPGKLVLTDLNNRAMPLIRYRVEDVGIISERFCECGRTLPMLERLEGRVADFLKKSDGSLVAGVSLVERTLTDIEGIEQMQIVQESLTEITLNIVPSANYSLATRDKLINIFQLIFGDQAEVIINCVGKIPQELSGKYRFSICKI